MPDTYRIGDWCFSPGGQDLRRGEERVKLEHRASRALALLCERRGQVVSQTDLVEHLWQGRQVSGNSLSVVIGDLRRALGDNARQPVFVETVAKAGYRLISGPEDDAPATDLSDRPKGPPTLSRRALSLIVLAAILAVIWGAYSIATHRAAPLVMLVSPVVNETGSASYDPLNTALNGLVIAGLNRQEGLRVIQVAEGAPVPSGRSGARNFRLRSKLVLWSGAPDLMVEVEDAATGVTVWSGSAYGPEDSLPAKVTALLDTMTTALKTPPASAAVRTDGA